MSEPTHEEKLKTIMLARQVMQNMLAQNFPAEVLRNLDRMFNPQPQPDDDTQMCEALAEARQRGQS